MLTILNTKNELKSWRKNSTKEARDKSNEFLMLLRFSIDWNQANQPKSMTSKGFLSLDERVFIVKMKEYIEHCISCKIHVENSRRVMKISLHNSVRKNTNKPSEDERLDKETYEIKAGFYGVDKYKHYDAVKARNANIMACADLIGAALNLISKTKEACHEGA